MTEVPIVTSRYRAVYDLLKADSQLPVCPVVTSVGLPRFMAEARDWHKLGIIAPYGIVGKVEDKDEFIAAYYERLTKKGVEAIHSDLLSIWTAQNPASWTDTPEGERKPLALLCFEDLDAGEWCHRRLFASWWLERTGQVIPELGSAEALVGVKA